ncbi:MAG: DUF488 domain-containing protein [Prosthecobacter sp.]
MQEAHRALTIGYGNRTIVEFLQILRNYDVSFLLDVRSSPYSRFSPAFNKATLEAACRSVGVRYLFVGDQLGGRPRSDSCYDSEGRVDYLKLAQEEYFREGISRLNTAVSKGISFALMCSELRPEECHRSKLIGEALKRLHIQIRHIDADGSLVDQSAVIDRITGGQDDLFGLNIAVSRSRGSYRTQQTND